MRVLQGFVLSALLVSSSERAGRAAFVSLCHCRRWSESATSPPWGAAKEQCLCVWPGPLPGAPGAVPADPGMDSEGWFAVNGWKYLVKWHHSGSYQLYPGKVPHGLCALSWLAGAGWLVQSPGMSAEGWVSSQAGMRPAARGPLTVLEL